MSDGAILLGYVALGILVTWPRATYLGGKLPNTRDQGSYVWDMWWIAHQVTHLASPFTTKQILAPVGVGLAYHALMPLIGLIMMPLTLTAGPAFAVNLFSLLLPGLIAYAMYRAARLWLAPLPAFASGAFFGLSSMVTWRTWFHMNLAAGILFLPITLEAAVRLRRNPSVARAVVLGLVLGLCVLVDLESAVLVVIVFAVMLGDWVLRGPTRRKLALVGTAAGVGLLVASPQIVAMVQQSAAAKSNPTVLAKNYVSSGVALTKMFAPSPRVAAFGLHGVAKLFYQGPQVEGMPTFGVTLTLLALLGAVVGWRRRRERIWLALWLSVCVMALGPVLYIGTRAYTPLPTSYHGQTLSLLLPYTWFVRVPGMAGFREADRFTPLGLMAAVLLAGSAVDWIRQRYAPTLLLVAAVSALELGWSTEGPTGTMPAGSPQVDRPVAADHSGSLVVDVPLGFRSGTLEVGADFPGEAQVEATLDGHPRAIGYVSRLGADTAAALKSHPFYADLLAMQEARGISKAQIRVGRADATRMKVGWVLVWTRSVPRLTGFLSSPELVQFLNRTGFSMRFTIDGVSEYRRSS